MRFSFSGWAAGIGLSCGPGIEGTLSIRSGSTVRLPSPVAGLRYDVPEGEVPVPGALGEIGAPIVPGEYVLAGSDGAAGIDGAWVGGPIVAGCDVVAGDDNAAGGRLMSPGPGSGVLESGAKLDAHEEHPPDVT
ncbi:MAG: hypothetical protein ACLP9L_34130 [Thermoguttaceae bacterium]